MITFTFRVDANTQSGYGHWFRCLALIEEILEQTREKVRIIIGGYFSDPSENLALENIPWQIKEWIELYNFNLPRNQEIFKKLLIRQTTYYIEDLPQYKSQYLNHKLTGYQLSKRKRNIRIDDLPEGKNYHLFDTIINPNLYGACGFIILDKLTREYAFKAELYNAFPYNTEKEVTKILCLIPEFTEKIEKLDEKHLANINWNDAYIDIVNHLSISLDKLRGINNYHIERKGINFLDLAHEELLQKIYEHDIIICPASHVMQEVIALQKPFLALQIATDQIENIKWLRRYHEYYLYDPTISLAEQIEHIKNTCHIHIDLNGAKQVVQVITR